MSVEIKFEPEGRHGLVAEGTYLWDAAKRLGISLPVECGGRGECDTCAVSVEEGATLLSAVTEAERTHLTPERLAAGKRLACQARAERSGQVTLRQLPVAESAPPAKDLRKEFRQLPLKEKLTTLAEFEVTTMFQALDALINVPFLLGDKILGVMAGRGRALDERAHQARHQPAANAPVEPQDESDRSQT